MITLYARLEPTKDSVLLEMCPNSKRMDTVIYVDSEFSEIKCRIPWYHKNRPISRKTITLNCFKYNLEWENKDNE